MYALIENNQVKQYPYGPDVLRRDNPQASFPKNPTDELLAEYNMYPVKPEVYPEHDPIYQNVNELTPVLINGQWQQVYETVDASQDEVSQRIAEYNDMQESNRSEAYKNESDPVFFKWQRGEATEQQWLDKIAEIKARYQDK